MLSKQREKWSNKFLAALTVAMVLPLCPNLLQAADDALSVDLTQARTVQDDSGKLRFIGAPLNQPIPLKANSGQTLADVVANTYAPLFGIANPARDLRLSRQTTLANKRKNIRYQQYYQGLPVIGGQLVANVDADNRLLSFSGETAASLKVPTKPLVSAVEAIETAIAAVSKWHDVNASRLHASKPQLFVYAPRLISPASFPANLVWRIEVSAVDNIPVREFVLIDAVLGHISVHFNQVDSARDRMTYTSNETATLPGTLVCDESDTDCAAGDADAQYAHIYARDTYDFYLNTHGRDSLDDNGMTLISSVHWNDGSNCPNAFWDGTQMAYCTGLSQGDDVVGHELTHGVTEHTSGLYYYYQSGAINESFSDVWGEFVDLTNTGGTDTPAVRWLMGEDVPGGALRNMADPPAYGDPDRMTSANYDTSALDNGGVHTNSGVNNKAAYLMVDGGSFNGQTVTGLGIDKTAKIYYEAQTNFLTSASDYLDLYNALYQGCLNLVRDGTATITDCAQVQAAIDAVEMDQQPVAGYNPDAAICPTAGEVPTDIFYDNLESGLANWTLSHDTGQGDVDWVDWYTTYVLSYGYGPYATSGVHSLFSYNTSIVTDQYAEITVTVPNTGSTPYLHFRHAFDFEANVSVPVYFDGGVVEYSIDGGTTWNDAGSLIEDGQTYVGSLSTCCNNPLAGRNAFAGTSHGYVSSRLNLSTLPKQSVTFRWRTGTDDATAEFGWFLDDVRIYTCGANLLPVADAGTDQSVYTGAGVTLDGSGSSDPDGTIASYLWVQTAGTSVSLSGAGTANPTFTAPPSTGTLTFELTVTDNDGASSTDTVVITVQNQPPIADAGPDQNVNKNASVTLNGTASSDNDGTIASYSWAQTLGTTVTLTGADTATPTFTAPSGVDTLNFVLTVTDNDGATDTDTVVITVVNQTPTAGAGPDQTVTAGGSVTLDGSGSSDPDGSIASYSWTQTAGTAVTLTGANTATPAFTAPASAGTLTFELTVTDNDGATATDSVDVVVNRTGGGSSSSSSSGGSSSSSSGGSSGGGGGCTIDSRAEFDPLLPGMLFFISMFYLVRRRKNQSD